MPRDFLIDTDTASDDAVALIMALRAPDVHVRAMTTVAGNVPVAQATRNALYVAERCGSNVPVYGGAAWRPMSEIVPYGAPPGATGSGGMERLKR